MSNLRTICRPHIHIAFFSSFICCRSQAAKSRVSFRNPNSQSRVSLPCAFSPWFDSNRNEPWFRVSQRRTLVRASKWTDEKSPYETLGKFLPYFLFVCSENCLGYNWTGINLILLFCFPDSGIAEIMRFQIFLSFILFSFCLLFVSN